MPSNSIKERFFFFLVIFIYTFLFLAIFFNNMTYKSNKITAPTLPEIVTSDGIVIAKNHKGYVYYLDTKQNENSEEIIHFIQKNFPLFKKEIIKKNVIYLLGKKILPLENQLPKGIIEKREYFRYYPYGEIFAHPVGLCKRNIIFGLELYNKNHFNNKVGKKLITTLNFAIQYHLYEGLKKGMKTYNSRNIHGIIQNELGEIIAIVSLPNFDPNSDMVPVHTNNGALYNIFEFGSTMKIFTFLLAFHLNVLKKDMVFNISEGAKIGEFEITDVTRNGALINTQEIFKKSSNIGTIKISEMIWRQIGPFFEDMLLAEPIMFNDITTPKPHMQCHGGKKYKYLSFGIGYSCSTGMLQVLRSFTSIFIDKMYMPSIIKDGKKKLPIKNIHFNNKQWMLDTLKSAVRDQPILNKYNVVGKTGTARIIVNGTYVKNLINTFYICSFVKNGKRYFMLLCMERPNCKSMFASTTVMKVAIDIIKNIMKTNL